MSFCLRLALPASVLLLAACSAEPASESASNSAQALDDQDPVALRETHVCDGCATRTAVVETKGRSFQDKVTIHYRGPSGDWLDRAGTFAGSPPSAEGDRALWVIPGLPADGAFEFVVHYQQIFSGGTGRDFWDNAGGANYTAAPRDPALGPGVDVAATDLGFAPGHLTARLAVRNLSSDKGVSAVYSTDGWKTVQTADAHFDHGSGGAAEVWTLDAPLAPGATSVAAAFVVRQNGGEAWDNAFGANYGCSLDPSGRTECHGLGLAR
jgi:hypothetical protein